MDPDVASRLKTILLTAVDVNPDRRFASMDELGMVLAAYLECQLT
jgi:hypothetical protein